MKDTVKLNQQNLSEISGGGWGYNKYSKGEYHEAGISTRWSKIPFTRDLFWLRITPGTVGPSMYYEEADKYVDYYKTHTEQEYIDFVKLNISGYTQVIKGEDSF